MKLAEVWLASGERHRCDRNNDAMPGGALKALRAGKFGIYGLGAQDDVLGAIKDDTIDAMVFTDYDTEVRVSVDVMNKTLDGGQADSAYMIPVTLITRTNVDNFMRNLP